METKHTQSLTKDDKLKIIDFSMDEYYFESRNPILNLLKKIIGLSKNKDEFKKLTENNLNLEIIERR